MNGSGKLLYWTGITFVIAYVSGLIGFDGSGGVRAAVAQTGFFTFLCLSLALGVVALVSRRDRRR